MSVSQNCASKYKFLEEKKEKEESYCRNGINLVQGLMRDNIFYSVTKV